MFDIRRLALLTCFCVASSTALAEVKTREVEYRQGETPLQGFIAWNDATSKKNPCVLVVHEWWGHNENSRNAARRLAEAGYVAMALDMFGKGKVTTHPEEAEAFMTEATKDPEVVAARFNAALALLKQDPHADATKIGAIGYCFGGGVVLERARSGADLKAVASFHGFLGTSSPAQPGKIKAKILVLTGAADPMCPPEAVSSFKKEMTAAGVKFEVVSYPGAKHAFTNPDADKAGVAALAYNAQADKQSWAAMLKFFKSALR